MYYIVGLGVLLLLLLCMNIFKNRRMLSTIEEEWQEKRKLSIDEPMDSVNTYWRNNRNHSKGVDSITWHDLSMDDIFQKINYTQTSVGSEYLYNQLHDIQLTHQDRNESFYNLMQENKEIRTSLLYELKKLGKRNHTNSSSFFSKDFKNIHHVWVYMLFGILPVASMFIIFLSIKLGTFILIASICLNIIIYYLNSRHLNISLYEVSYLASIIRTGKRLTKMKGEPLKQYTEDINKSIKPIRKFLFLERILSLGKGTGDLEGIFEYIRIIFLLDFISYFYMIRMIQNHKDSYEKLWKTIGAIDAGLAVAFYRHSIVDYCTPTFINREELIFTEMVHPLINDPVKNSSHLNKLTLITGSNASGKSTYMKAVAINAILAQSINTVLASSWSMKPSYVLSSMAIQDNVVDGDSYFIAEIKSLKRIIQKVQSGVPCLSFIDEILRGTNTVERIAASASIMEWLRKHKGMTLVASHDIELTKMAGGFANYHFHETIQEGTVSFDYKIHQGPSTTKNAIKLLEQMDYPSSVTELANSLAVRFEEKKEWNEQLGTIGCLST